ncbi:MAG: hypothetical protein COY73_01195 [Candidatus Nealsonbacteria bacterium CG_4_10_14_0_8_um_filter_37_14]|uniref:Uncharacterized protein n=1 Tax=Candidatus Nealsonbacteria bacterium CG_4_10_14_0_8_um_filter_37_14 TaxID=1974684 RepID=A0A2M7R7C6_9BACT|nr:MAG: hypothetical protein COV63_02645 [Candidatus Nealsonbacteria bacterium CG11_big_fil_rev_8_21_14_0_20_37_68]PIW91984.1 MAG: hypothetical protein COZ89_02315 [Candidatus Nealsonbacteria bacterium CG_4_8_14_3_um_filter_37_23]PIY89325.1 MAG: hypothetical protein COY73_01195 [Candidatus Nealsonbacteria bacterium CG_4_10_14_0_8_um_filter_37_14]
MQRPLEKQVSDEFNWFMGVQEMPHTSGISYPVFEWSFGAKDGIKGGTLRAWPFQGILVFEVRGEEEKFDSIKIALKSINEYGWGEPPHINEVLQDILETKSKFPVRDIEEAKQVFKELRQKWQTLVAS